MSQGLLLLRQRLVLQGGASLSAVVMLLAGRAMHWCMLIRVLLAVGTKNHMQLIPFDAVAEGGLA